MKHEIEIHDFGTWVKKRRKEVGMRQNILAALVGRHENNISHIETGDCMPKLDIAEKIVNALGAELVIRENAEHRESDK